MYPHTCTPVSPGPGSHWHLKPLVTVKDFNLVRNCTKKAFTCTVKHTYGEAYGMSDFDFM